MGDNVEDIEPDVFVPLSDLPPQYRHHLMELKPVIKSLFPTGSGGGDCDEESVDSEVVKFLEMCHQVFDLDYHPKGNPIGTKLSQQSLTCGEDSPSNSSCSINTTNEHGEILINLMIKYRSHFRKRFRGYTYIRNSVLQETFEVAYTETKCTYSDKWRSHKTKGPSEKVGIMSLLRKGMLQEFQWIEKVNEYKRQMLLDSITDEVIEDFEVKMKAEFPSAFSDDDNDDDFSTTFYEENELKMRVDRMVESVVEDFKKQLPYEEEPEELVKLGMDLKDKLQDCCVQDLIERNTRNKENAESFMDRLVEHATNQYRDKFFKIIAESPIIEPDQALNYHQMFQSELMQKYQHEDSRFTNEKMHDQFVNLLNESILESLKELLAHCNDTGSSMLAECKTRSKAELEKCLRKIARIFDEYSLSQYFDDLCEKIEVDLKDSLNEIRHCTILNAEKMEETLETAKSPVLDAELKPVDASSSDDAKPSLTTKD